MNDTSASTNTSGPRAVLVGAPGSGKTTVGKLLAKRWGVDFRDTDHDIEASSGMSVSDIFVVEGEESFRTLERAAVASALKEHTGVLGLGAGAVLSEETRALLKGHTVIHLQAGLSAAMQRLHMNRSRPLLLGNVRGRWQQLDQERQPLYAEVSTVTVSTDGLTPKEVAEAVVTALGNSES